MRKHGLHGTLSSRFWLESTDASRSRRKTSLSFESGRQSFLWTTDSGREKVTKS